MEKTLPNGQKITLEPHDRLPHVWNVACWNADDTNHWSKEFTHEDDAKHEYNRWN